MFFSDWGLIPYAEAWQRQTEWFDSLIQAKQNNDVYENHIVFCEHPHVYTLGRSGKENNMLLSEAQLEKIGAPLYHIDRGGDITYHGPGQLVCYPILNLEEFGLGLKEYVHLRIAVDFLDLFVDAFDEIVIFVDFLALHIGKESFQFFRNIALRTIDC